MARNACDIDHFSDENNHIDDCNKWVSLTLKGSSNLVIPNEAGQ